MEFNFHFSNISPIPNFMPDIGFRAIGHIVKFSTGKYVKGFVPNSLLSTDSAAISREEDNFNARSLCSSLT